MSLDDFSKGVTLINSIKKNMKTKEDEIGDTKSFPGGS